MPIHPDQRHRYPADWPAISLRVRAEAGWRCEECGVGNGELGGRGPRGEWMPAQPLGFDCVMPRPGDLSVCDGPHGTVLAQIVRIVLTVAHLDHHPEHNDRANLRAWCQRCHLNHDRRHHRARGRAHRRAAMYTRELELAGASQPTALEVPHG